MRPNSAIRIINSVPIIGIQYEVASQNNENEVKLEYLALNPEKLMDALQDPEDISPMALFDLIYSGMNLRLNFPSMTTRDGLLFESLEKNDDMKMFFNALNVIYASDTVDKLVIIKEIRERGEYPFDKIIF